MDHAVARRPGVSGKPVVGLQGQRSFRLRALQLVWVCFFVVSLC
jgi:hypothetical protein